MRDLLANTDPAKKLIKNIAIKTTKAFKMNEDQVKTVEFPERDAINELSIDDLLSFNIGFFFDSKDDYGSLATFQFQFLNEKFDKETGKKLKSKIFGMEPYIERSPPNRIIPISSDPDNQYFCRVKKIIGNYVEYCDEDGDWRRR